MADVDPTIMAEIRAKLDADWERTEDGWTADGAYPRPIWSPAGFLARLDRFVIICACGDRRDAPLEEIVRAGLGDRPMHTLSWKACQACGGTEFEFEVIDGPRLTVEEELAESDDGPDPDECPEDLRADL